MKKSGKLAMDLLMEGGILIGTKTLGQRRTYLLRINEELEWLEEAERKELLKTAIILAEQGELSEKRTAMLMKLEEGGI